MKTYLYLDFDGVLHPDDVHIVEEKPVLLDNPDGKLFMWEPHLVEVLAAHPDVQLILSTSWVPCFGEREAAAYLCEALRERVVGTSQRELRLHGDVRAYQVERHVREFEPDHWI